MGYPSNVGHFEYAEGEAVLGWLNASMTLQGEQIDWSTFASAFLQELGKKIDAAKMSVFMLGRGQL